jgi:hypothetical protein
MDRVTRVVRDQLVAEGVTTIGGWGLINARLRAYEEVRQSVRRELGADDHEALVACMLQHARTIYDAVDRAAA